MGKLQPIDQMQTPWIGLWYDKSSHGFSSQVISLSDIRKFKGHIKAYIKKNKFYEEGSQRPNYVMMLKDANSENPLELSVEKSEEKETFTREEVVSMLSGLYSYESVCHVKNGAVDDGNRGYDSGDVCVEDFAEPIDPDTYIDEWKEFKEEE